MYDVAARRFVGHVPITSESMAIAWSADGTQLALCSGSGEIRIWNVEGTRVLP
jgi:hypothetical protein